ncbi:MAG: D-alanyl-D-alanine carboxypeptidase [Clostridiales bacterium]|nr:D-alanyl-D-alanine carboxypeptidase [Clostridiales bacterium]
MRKILYCAVASFILIASVCSLQNKITASAVEYAKSEIAMELLTGKVLSENNADKILPMASTTKIITAILIIEDCDLNKVVKVPKDCVGVDGSSIYLKEGEEISIRDLLYGLMLRSGNDSANMLAKIHSGDLNKFVNAMNEKAKQIGANNTNFTNPSGLPDDNHYTTARDLCKISAYAMKNPTFSKIVSTKNYQGDFRDFTNKNKMLSICKGANGVKTGYTLKAGRCLVSSVKRGNMDILCVVLNCPDMYERSIEIIESCFNKYELLTISKNKRFIFNGKICCLKNNQSFVRERGEDIIYKIKPIINSNNHISDTAIANLQIYSKNNLIFSGNLYNI